MASKKKPVKKTKPAPKKPIAKPKPKAKAKLTPKPVAAKKPLVATAPIIAPKPAKRSSKEPQLLRGFKDILPTDAPYWHHIERAGERAATFYGYNRVSTPILELKDLFVRSVGQDTDIVSKEMFAFTDIGGDEVVLRPEATASMARAYVNHGMLSMPQPVRMWYQGPMFRHERPQAGRYRQFHQFGVEAFGDAQPVVDAEVIAVAVMMLRDIGLPVNVEINSIGCTTCRKTYRDELVKYYRLKRDLLCEDCKIRLQKNPLRLLDCKESQCEFLKRQAPQTVDWLDEPCRDHFFKVLEYLDEANIPYSLNALLVRGLDYYNRTVFEIVAAESLTGEKKEHVAHALQEPLPLETPRDDSHEVAEESGDEQSTDDDGVAVVNEVEEQPTTKLALGGGGRYDSLVEMLGGRPTPAVGFALGMERLVLEMKARNIAPPKGLTPKVFLAQLGEQARRKIFALMMELRATSVTASAALSKEGLKSQLEIANKLGVTYSVIVGQKEVLDGTAIIRDMESGIQETVDYRKIVHELHKKLGITTAAPLDEKDEVR